MWWRKPKVSFVSMVDGVAETMPIVRSNSVQRQWAKRMRAEAASIKPAVGQRFEHVSRCSGLNAIMSRGWVQRAWQDIAISPTGDGNFEWATPIDQKAMHNDVSVGDYVGFHTNTYAEAIGDTSALRQIVKIQSPWVAYIPTGYSLLCAPVAYPDNVQYEAASGILDSAGRFPVQLAVQLVFRNLKEPTVIRAGDPLCQYFLVKSEPQLSEVRSATDIDRRLYKAAFIASRGRFINAPNCAKFVGNEGQSK